MGAAIVPAHGGDRRTFRGVSFLVLARSERSMVTKMLYRAGDAVGIHQHPNEQAGYVVSGRYRLRLADAVHDLSPGDSYVIPPDVPHGFEIIEPGEVVDVFTPPRADYL